MKFLFFNTNKPRQFDYRPRFYNQAEEEREARKRELLGQDYKTEEGEYKPGQYISQMRIRRGIIANRERNERRQRRTLRSIVMLVLLIAFAWWFVKTDFSNSIWAVFLGGNNQTQQVLTP